MIYCTIYGGSWGNFTFDNTTPAHTAFKFRINYLGFRLIKKLKS